MTVTTLLPVPDYDERAAVAVPIELAMRLEQWTYDSANHNAAHGYREADAADEQRALADAKALRKLIEAAERGKGN